MSFDDEKELEQLKRRQPRDRPRDDNRVEIDILLNVAIRSLRLQRAQIQVLREIRDLLKK